MEGRSVLEQSELLGTRMARAFVLVWGDRMAWRGCKALRISGGGEQGTQDASFSFCYAWSLISASESSLSPCALLRG